MNRYLINSAARSSHNNPGLFATHEYRMVDNFFGSQPNLLPTPLHHLRGLASQIKIGDLLVKDESTRFGLTSFKLLGVSYAVGRLLSSGRLAKGSALACATEGNHGRAVARVAAENCLESKIYVAAETTPARIGALEGEGAHVTVVDGNYDDAVRQAARDAAVYGWQIISDTSWPGYEEIPRWIMAGYTQLMTEAEEQWTPDRPPDAVLVQAGVGGLACAVVSWLCQKYGPKRPYVIVCEPLSAACLLESFRAGRPVSLPGPFDTIMTGLRCGEVSLTAWPVIARAVDAFISVADGYSERVMRMLAHPTEGDTLVTAGASGACGLAGLLALTEEESFRLVRAACGLNEQSRVLAINTEGATDPDFYAQVIGCGSANFQ
jgi:diaminopropionate ammonia-lyase